MRRSVSVFLAVAVLPIAAAVGARPAAAAGNSPIVVSTPNDVIDGGDGLTSLREAVAQANAQAGDDTIVLASGETYELTICGDESTPDNSFGDLDATGTDALTIRPVANATLVPTIDQTCPQRVIEQGSGALTLKGIALVGGSNATGPGFSVLAAGPLTLDHVDVSGASGALGATFTDAAVRATGRPLSIIGSRIHDNGTTGVSVGGTGTFADAVISGTTIDHNDDSLASTGAGGVASTAPVTVDASTVSDNKGHDGGGMMLFDGQITDSVITRNTSLHTGGGLMGVFSLTNSQLTDNTSGSGGGALGQFDVQDSTVSGNSATGPVGGGGLIGIGSVTDSTISGNVAAGAGGGILAIPSTQDAVVSAELDISSSTITDNQGQVGGGIVAMDNWSDFGASPPPDAPPVSPITVSIAASTLVGNTAVPPAVPDSSVPMASELAFARTPGSPGEPVTNTVGTLSASGSVLGSGTSSTPVCSLAATSSVESGGYNFSADGSCVVGSPGDIVSGGDAELGPLQNNNGPTETMMPLVGSPLIDQVPVGSAGCGPTPDQRNQSRPVGPRCDIGSVEAPLVRFHAVDPVRIKDTRPAPQRVGSGGAWGAGETQTIAVTGGISGVQTSAVAVVLNITVVNATVAGDYLSVWPAGAAQPTVSSLNVSPGQVRSNQVTVKVGAGGSVAIFNAAGNADVIVDVNGYYSTESGDGYTSIAPTRVIDSRPPPNRVGPLSAWGPGVVQDVTVAGGSTGVPSNADAVVVNITATGGSANGDYLSVWPSGLTMPTVSSLNMDAGQTVASQVTVRIGTTPGHTGKISIFNAGGTQQVIVDIVGYFQFGGGKAFHPLVPSRVIDSRPPPNRVGPLAGWGPGAVQTVDVTTGGLVPSDAASVITNVTATGGSVNGDYLTVWPAGVTRPTASSLNVDAGKTVPNAVTTGLGSGPNAGQLSVFNAAGAIHVIIDISGYYD